MSSIQDKHATIKNEDIDSILSRFEHLQEAWVDYFCWVQRVFPAVKSSLISVKTGRYMLALTLLTVKKERILNE